MLQKVTSKHRHNAAQVYALLDTLVFLPLGASKGKAGKKS